MTVTIEYEAQKRLELPFEEIIRQVDGQIRIQWDEEKEQTGV